MAENNQDGRARDVAGKGHEVDLPSATAKRARRLWNRMLRSVRYPERSDFEFQDATAIKYGLHGMHGEVSPNTDGPRILALEALGLSLIEYCEAVDGDRATVLKKVEANCVELERLLGKDFEDPPVEPGGGLPNDVDPR